MVQTSIESYYHVGIARKKAKKFSMYVYEAHINKHLYFYEADRW